MYGVLRRINTELKDQVVDFAQQLVCRPSPSLEEKNISDLVYQQMKVIAHKGPGVNVEGLLFTKILQAGKEIHTIRSAAKYL